LTLELEVKQLRGMLEMFDVEMEEFVGKVTRAAKRAYKRERDEVTNGLVELPGRQQSGQDEQSVSEREQRKAAIRARRAGAA
jgi:hypothetical protein